MPFKSQMTVFPEEFFLHNHWNDNWVLHKISLFYWSKEARETEEWIEEKEKKLLTTCRSLFILLACNSIHLKFNTCILTSVSCLPLHCHHSTYLENSIWVFHSTVGFNAENIYIITSLIWLIILQRTNQKKKMNYLQMWLG